MKSTPFTFNIVSKMKMKYFKLSVLILLCLTLYACSEIMKISVQILSLKSKSEYLEIKFDFKRYFRKGNMKVHFINIYEKDSLIYRLATTSISSWNFPEVGDSIFVIHPPNTDKLRKFKKSENINFDFRGVGKMSAFGEWKYKSMYSIEKYRWLFDENGNQIIDIDYVYISNIGKDVIIIRTEEEHLIDVKSIKLLDKNMIPIGFEIKGKKDISNELQISLNEPLQLGEHLNLSLVINGKSYEDKVVRYEYY